jgi:hypothetical protein
MRISEFCKAPPIPITGGFAFETLGYAHHVQAFDAAAFPL